ncbi:MAG: PA14 domain-containing protein, partial [Bacteroidota bacterium]
YINSKISSSKYETIEMSDKIQYKYYEGRWAVLPNFINMTPKRIGTTDKFSLEGLEYSELYFGFVMHGYVSVENAGNYTFYTATNDGSKLLVDNVEIIDNDGAHGTIEKSGKVYLEKGKHLIELRYFQAGGGKAMKVFWKGPNFEKREMTKEDLSGN